MDSPLTPELAIAYLRELSVDVQSAVLVDAEGRCLAGPPELAEPARAVLAAGAAAEGLAIRTSAGWVFGVRSHGVGVVVAAGPWALPGLVLHDVSEVMALLDEGAAAVRPVEALDLSPVALRELGEAVQRAVAGVATLSSGDR